MKMPTTTNNKVEAKPSTDGGDAAKQCLNCLEKKVRNLEKRKGRIEQNQEKARKGTKLEKEQENSLQQYEQVTHDLEFARELQKQFLQINGEHEKMAKKQAKREKAERQALEIKRISEILQLQSLLDLLGGDKVREDFKTGKHGAVVLTEDNLSQLDELYQAISPSRDDSGEEYPQRLNTAAEHLVNFLDGKDRQVVGTTYKELKELITLINGCGYFERARKAETEDNVSESNQETEEFVDTTEEPVNDSETETANGQEVTETPQQQQPQQQQPIDLTMGTSGATQSQRDLPTQPLNTLEQDVFFAPSSTPYEADAETQFSQPSHTAASRMPDFQSFTHNRPFQFIQTSYVMPESAPGVVDPAVIAAQPAGSSGLTFISQGFDATAAQAPTAAQQQAPQPQQQQQPQSQPQQPSAPQQSNQPVSSVGVGDLSSNAGGLQQQPQQTTSQPPQSQQQQQQQTQDFSSQSYAQAGLQQNLQAEGLFSAQPVAVTEVSNSLPSHSGIMAQMREENVTTSPYEIPPSIPMPPSQSQDQSQRDQQQQQQEKKFQMNASAPVFQSMYAQQVAAGQAGPVNVPPPSVTDTQAPPPPTDFTSAPTPGGDFGQPNTDFPQTYQSNNGFASGGYQRGGRGGGFRGSRGGGGNGGNRNSGAGGNPMQNGFSGRGGATNTNSNRGGRGGTYQGYPPNNNYRPESFQGSYNAGGFGGGFQKRGGMNAGGPGGATYPRGSAGGNAGRGGTGGGGMRGGMPRGGGTGPRGAPRGGFNRPMPTQ